MGRSLALLAIGLVAAFFLLQVGGGSGVEAVDPCPTDPIDAKAPCYVVNATADLPDRDLDDPKCEVEPGGSNKCTLRAAIEQANFETKSECDPCTIRFDPLIFPPGPPGGPQTIPIDDDDTEGLLPAVQVPLTIDAVGAGVILEPSIHANGGTGLLEYGLMVLDDTPANPTDFALYGNDFTIRGFIDPHGPVVDANGDGIYICGHSVQGAFDPTVAPYDATADDCDEAGPIENVHIENVTIALNGSEGIHIESDGASNVTFDTLAIFGNGSESTDGKGISIEAGTANPVTGYLQNSSVHSVGDAFEVEGEKCLFDVIFNPLLTGLDGGVDLSCADGSVIHIDDNGPITGKAGHGVDVEVGDGSTVTVNRNGDIHGGDQKNAVDVGSGIGLTLEIIGNGHLQGGGLGISLAGDSGAEITIMDNGPDGSIRGDTEEAIELGGLGDGSSARIANNGTLTGGNSSPAITAEGDDDLVVEIDNNRTIEGAERTIEVKGGDDVFVDITNNWDIINNRGSAIYIRSMGDQTVLIEKNGDIIGAGTAIETEAFVGGNNILDVFFNGDIIGYDIYGIVVTTRGDSWVNVSGNGATQVAGAAGDEYAPGSIVGGNYGIYVDVTEDSFLWVERNGDVIGHDDDAVFHDVSGDAEAYIRDNGHIVGGRNGIHQDVTEDALLVIEDNGGLEGWETDAVHQAVAGDGELFIRRNGAGGTIEGGDDGIFQEVGGDATLIVEDNGDIIGYGDTAIEQSITSGNADSEIRGNGNIIGATDGVYLDVGGNNDLVLEDNGRIEGWDTYAIEQSVSENNDAFIGRNGDILGGSEGIDFSVSEDNDAVIEDNGNIIGFDSTGVYSSISGDDDLTLLRNGDIIGGSYGIYQSVGENAFLLVKDNGDIEGWDTTGIYHSISGDGELIAQRNGLAGSIKGGDYGFYISAAGNQTTLIEENGDIIGFDTTGIYRDISGDLDSLIQNNNDILGGDDGIYDSVSGAIDESILNNDDIIGYSDSGIEFSLGTDIDIDIGFNGGTPLLAGAAGGFFPRGAIIGGDDGIYVSGCSDDADIYIHDQGSIIGQEDDGIFVSCGDTLELTVDKNLDIHGGADDQGLDVTAGVSAIVRVSNNNDLVGGEDGAEFDLGDSAQLYVENNGPDGSITGGDGDGLDIRVGDDSRVDVINNGDIHGGDDDGVDVDGGDSIVVNILDNADITGAESGIELDATTLEFHIDRNDDIKGDDEDGIQAEDAGGELDIIEGTIIDNGLINGHGRDGIRLIGEGMPAGAPSRLQNVTISGNIIGNGSEDRGIYLECLKDANDCIGFGNVIADNLIVGNGEEGVFLRGDFDEAFTLNTVGPDNVIMRNGGPGVRITDSSDNTIVGNHIIENGGVGFDIPRSGIDISEAVGEADRNTITKNSFWSNIGLGIDLQGDGLGCGPFPDDPNDCIETPPRPDVDGNSISGRIGPPEGVDLCTFCTVEAFVVHNPADPTGFGEGATYIGRAQTDGTGDYKIDVDKDAACGAKAGAVTITLTDEDGSTSEFSRNTGGFDGTNDCAPTATPPPPPTDTPLPPTATDTPAPVTPTDTPVPPTATDTAVAPTATNTAEPPTATPTATDVPPDNCGDVNNDGVVDSEDALAILQAKAGFTDGVPKPSAADVDGDGEMTSQDALIILQVAAGFIDRSDLNCP